MYSVLLILGMALGCWAIYQLVFLPRQIRLRNAGPKEVVNSSRPTVATPVQPAQASDLAWPRALESALDRIYSRSASSEKKLSEQNSCAPRIAHTTLMGLVKSFEKISALQSSLKSLSNPALSLRDVGDIVAQDPILSAQVLKAANAPAFGLLKEVHSVHAAVNILGLKYVKSILLYRHLPHDLFATAAQRRIFTDLWAHMTCTAILAAEMAQVLGDLEETSLYTAGLMHDIGKLVLTPLITDDLTQSYPATLVQEYALLSTTHVDVARFLAQRDQGAATQLWDLVQEHHQPTLPPTTYLTSSRSKVRTLTVLFLANQLAKLISSSGEIRASEDIFLERLDPAYAEIISREELGQMLFHKGLMQEIMDCSRLVQAIQALT